MTLSSCMSIERDILTLTQLLSFRKWKTMQQYHILVLIALLVCSGLLISLSQTNDFANTSSAVAVESRWFDDRKTAATRRLDTPQIISDQPPHEDSRFVVPEANLADTKHAKPTVIRSLPTYVTHITYGDSCPLNTDGNCNGSCDCRWSWPSNELGRAPWTSPEAKCRCKKTIAAHNGMVVDVLSIGSKTRPELVSIVRLHLSFQD